MRESTKAKLRNARGRVTLHVFVRLDVREKGMYAIFCCTETCTERVFGCIRHGTDKLELEQFFGPLDDELYALPTGYRQVA